MIMTFLNGKCWLLARQVCPVHFLIQYFHIFSSYFNVFLMFLSSFLLTFSFLFSWKFHVLLIRSLFLLPFYYYFYFICFTYHTDTLYEGGFFKGNNQHITYLLYFKCLTCNFISFFSPYIAHLYFPKEYPLRPPRMRFVTEIWHPNIDQNGDGK